MARTPTATWSSFPPEHPFPVTEEAASLAAVLTHSRELGFLGPGDIEPQIEHATRFATAFESEAGGPPRRALDLGSGGGIPGLVLADRWTSSDLVLLDGSSRRCRFLEAAVMELGFDDRVTVVEGRAEDLAHEPHLRAHFDLVVARSFGPPAVVAECGGPLLDERGSLVVSEPPEGELGERWDPAGLAQLGLGPARLLPGTPRMVIIERTGYCPDRFPRRVGVPAKRPLF